LFSSFFCSGKQEYNGIVETTVSAKVDYTKADVEIFKKYIRTVGMKKTTSLNNLIIETALFFKDRPYVAHTLEKDPERLVVNLRELDCTTFVETVIALSKTIKLYPDPAFENFCGELQKIRYRNGVIKDYTSRIHYFSDWIYENERRGFVKDITKSIGGVPYSVSVSFMSSHPESYKQLKERPEFVNIIAKQEKEISGRKIYSMISKGKIETCKKGIKDGDIICLVTDIKGLDISHVGFAVLENGKLTFIHASSSSKKVIINKEPLIEYLTKIKNNVGIMVLRLN
jgi:hypothetical protein